MDLQIGDQDVIGIFSVFEEGQLLGFDGVFGDRTSHYHKAMNPFPTVGFVSKFSHFPSIAKLSETTGSGSIFDSGIFFGDNGIATSFLVELFDHLFAEHS